MNSGWPWKHSTWSRMWYAAFGQKSLEAITVAPSGSSVTWSWWLISKVSSDTSGSIHGAWAASE
ncbi:hypothetical protein D3C84_1184110 [compost metagenome]